jgi:hypothetical protein
VLGRIFGRYGVRLVDPNLKLGGPSFEGVIEDVQVWPDAEGRVSWLGRFFDYLREHDRIQEFSFLSFEHYPYDACNTSWNDLYREPENIGQLVLRAPCLPFRIWCTSSRTNSPA